MEQTFSFHLVLSQWWFALQEDVFLAALNNQFGRLGNNTSYKLLLPLVSGLTCIDLKSNKGGTATSFPSCLLRKVVLHNTQSPCSTRELLILILVLYSWHIRSGWKAVSCLKHFFRQSKHTKFRKNYLNDTCHT